MDLTVKIKIRPDSEALEKLWTVSNLCTTYKNACLEQRRMRSSYGKVNFYSQKKELRQIKQAFPEFKIPSSQVLQEVALQVGREYESFFSKRKNGDLEARPPKFRSRKYFYTQTYPQEGTSFVIHGNSLKLAYGKGRKDWIDLTIDREIPGKPSIVKIGYDRTHRHFWVSVSYRIEALLPMPKTYAIYFDPGVKTTLSGIKTDGTFVEYDMNSLRKVNKKTYLYLDDLISQKSKKEHGSASWRRLNKRIQKAWSKLENRTKTYLHTMANRILNDHWDTTEFLIGDWSKKDTLAKTENEYVNRAINRAVQNNNPIQRLIGYLKYKANRLGKRVDKFDERGTTRTCAMCKHVHKNGISPNQRVFECEKCSFTYDRDRHSALNFIRLYEPALWKCLREDSLTRSMVRTCLNSFSLKPKVRKESYYSTITLSPSLGHILNY